MTLLLSYEPILIRLTEVLIGVLNWLLIAYKVIGTSSIGVLNIGLGVVLLISIHPVLIRICGVCLHVKVGRTLI